MESHTFSGLFVRECIGNYSHIGVIFFYILSETYILENHEEKVIDFFKHLGRYRLFEMLRTFEHFRRVQRRK